MVQSLSLSTLTTSGNTAVYGSDIVGRKHSEIIGKPHLKSGIGRQSLWNGYLPNFYFKGNPNLLRRRNFGVQAGWPFTGGGGGEQELGASSERSEASNEDILIFFFQLDLTTQVQRALNLEEYEIAQQLRNKLTEVEAEMLKQQEAKRGLSSKSEAQDKAISIVRLRGDLQNAIETENYALAAQIRDDISKLEAESLAASAKALAYENAQYAFRLGQKVKHKTFGYRAVICGMDPVCCESSSWMETAQVEKLSRGSNQPFYQVLVDVYADPNLLVAYVPEENLLAPEEPDLRRFDHPYISFLFYGMDAAGDFIPIKQLREKYNRPRHEIPLDPEGDEVAGLHHGPLPSTKLIESYAYMGSFRSSKLVFQNFPNPDSFMWGVLIKCSVWSNLFEEAIFLYHTMIKSNQVQISSFIFPSVLRACSGFGDLGIGRMVHGAVIKNGFDEDSVIQTSLLRMYGEMRCLSYAKKVFDEMPTRDLISWSSVICTYVENGKASEGLEMFRSMVLEGFRPDSVTMLSVAEACGELGLLKLARLVHGYILRRQIEGVDSLANSLVVMYSKCGDLSSAKRVFLSVINPSTTSWTAMISSYNRSGRFMEASEAFVDMLNACVEPNSVTMMSVVGTYAGLGWLREGKSVHCYIIRKEMDPENVLGPVLIELYAECGNLNYCENVLHMVGGKDIVSWNMLISVYSQKGFLTKALELLVQMQTRGLMPDSFSLSSSLSACADGGLLQFGDQIHGHIIKRGLSDDFILNSLIDMYSKCGLTELAHMIFDQIEEKTVVTWNSMICGFSQNGNSVEAISLFDQMYLDGLEISDFAFLSVLQACSNLGYLEKGKWLHHKLLTYGLQTNLYTDTALTDMYAKCGDLLTARRVFDRMPEKSVVSWSVMIAGYGAHGRVDAAISLFNQMVESGVRPNQVTFMNILSACSHAGSLEDGKSFFNAMGDSGVEPSSEHYACVVDLLSRGGDLNEAYRIIKTMPFPADASIWSALLNGCRIHHRLDMINAIEKDLLSIRTDDTGYYTLLSNIYGEEGNWKEFGKVRSVMKRIGLRKVPGYSIIELDKKVYRFGVGDTSPLYAEETFKFLENLQNLAQEHFCNFEYSNLMIDNVVISKDVCSQQKLSNCI
ncbi:hypothetical protein COLO4_27936 [Corchorus olitorius]|uniref:Hemimethylated DNA-binding domain-containing protein n=1 Tax=Corchorus olitorius TaxID=93759 RepID=A0A1R3HNJ3_9ROSI|nr:hypothetical protein COLO4_27936 [Corchorus olitorius]